MAVMSIPAALQALLEGRERDLLDNPDPNEVVAEAVADIVQVLLDEAALDIDELLDSAIMHALGGADYVRAVLAWREAVRGRARSRSRRKGSPPEPPTVPS
jgi:hypothetical protein